MAKGDDAAERGSGVALKASVLRGLIAAMDHKKITASVLEGVTPATRRLMQEPPPSSAWIDLAPCEEIALVVEKLHGLPAVRRMGHDSIELSIGLLTRSLTEGLLRLFGATPLTVLTRVPQFASLTSRGIEHAYRSTEARAGVLAITMPKRRDVPMALWEMTAGTFEPTFRTCGFTGTVSAPAVQPGAARNSVELAIRWDEKRA